MHGLILATPVAFSQVADNHVSGRLDATDFDGRWPGRMDLEFDWRLDSGGLELRVGVIARGAQPLPVGIGWHPYFRTSTGRRRDVELTLPARTRVEVCDYVDVFPSGRLLGVERTAYDFTSGRPLGDLNLDDCFTDLRVQGGRAVAELRDPATGLGLRIASTAPPVRAIQVYAPTAQDFVAIEPQFNLADPYSPVWDGDIDTGMLRLPPGGRATYEVTVSPFASGGSNR